MDVILFCADVSTLVRGTSQLSLHDQLPIMQSFGTAVAYCSGSKRVAVGASNGNLAIYALQTAQFLRPARLHTINGAHSGPIIAISFSPDAGRLLATYSHQDAKLCIWQVCALNFNITSSCMQLVHDLIYEYVHNN